MSWEMMSIHDIKTIAIIGSGKVANTLGSLFYEKGIEVFAVSSRNNETGIPLANKLISTEVFVLFEIFSE
jgi:glutamate dehydrogenase/leucine dehydrogenase